MNLTSQTELLVKDLLCNSGRLVRDQTITLEPMPGNPERRDYTTRRRFLVRTDTSSLAVLVVGKDLTQLRQKSELFSQAYPDLACSVFAHGNVDDHDLLLTDYFAGLTAGEALNDPSIGETGVLPALELLASRLNRTFLDHIVFPFAAKTFSGLPVRCRASNGDFVLNNILFNSAGEVRVIDYEQAVVTHFYSEDWLRFTYWKTPGKLRAFALQQISEPVESVQLYLWLKQMAFEAEVNQPAKAQADLQYWGRELRRMLDQQDHELQDSLLWPTEKRSEVSQLLQLQSKAPYNYARAIELYNFARQREIKIRQMQASFSWRATAWLRALRRICIDPYTNKRPRPQLQLPQEAHPDFPFSKTDFFWPGAIQLHYQINNPVDWSAKGDVIVEGWAYTGLAIKLCGIRARIGERAYPGTYGLDRADVADKFLPQAASGFRIEATIGQNDPEIVLETVDEQGVWYPFFSKSFGLPCPRHLQPSFRNYTNWAARYDTLDSVQLDVLRRLATALEAPPLISVVLPVYNIPEDFLRRAIESVRAQIYPYWELCIADDASTQSHIKPLIERYAKQDPRIKPVFRATNGHISAATNSGIEIATGAYTAFLDHDDELAPHALFCIAQLVAEHPTVEVIYSDEDKIDETGQRFSPHFKPDWNPDLLTSQNYFCHLTAYKTATLRAVGGVRLGYEGSQDWDLALRVTERLKPAQILHIPRVLYHWRAIEGSTAESLSAKQYTGQAGRKAVEEHFIREGLSVRLSPIMGGHWRVHYVVPESPPLVTLIIPTRNRRELLIRCVESILDKTTYRNFEILIADNESDDPKLNKYYKKAAKRGHFTVLPCPGPFNFSAINNRAVEQAHGEIIGLLNNDLETINPDWLDEMVGHALRPDIGVVGAKLYYPDMTVQHAGVITGIGGVAGHAFKHSARRDQGTPQNRAHVTHNVSAVTAACAVLRKSVFLEAGGFDENNLKIAFNDVDFCLRVQDLGYRNLFTPFAEFIHHESASRGAEDSPDKIARFQTEVAFMKQRWGKRLLNDPAYNPNLSLETEDFAYACPPRVEMLPRAT
jgi:GT2 family glycosyltransferase